MQEPSDPIETARDSLNGYIANGPAYWPCAKYFTLASLTASGETDGSAADVCRECVRWVAESALDVMNGTPIDFESVPEIGEPYSAVITCGLAPAYDVTGNDDTYAAGYDGEHTTCAQCGGVIE